MNNKLNKLFAAARKETPATPEAGFENLVLAAIRSEPMSREAAELSLADQLSALFPRLAWVTAVIVVLCLATDFGLSAWGVPTLTEGVAEISNQWLVAANDI